MSHTLRRPAAVTVAGCAALALVAPAAASAAVHQPASHAAASASAKGTHKIKKGTSTLAVNVDNYLFITGDGFSITPTGKATQNGTNVTFPVTGGTINAIKQTGTIKQSGGLSVSKGGVTIVFKNAIANLHKRTATSTTTGKKKGFVALKLSKPTSTDATKKGATFNGVTVSFSKKAIAYLDKTFSTTDFKTHAQLGTATTQVTYKKKK